jgi:hypothetical protein
MRFRSMLASLVVTLLLAISCVANACQTSCDLNSVALGCHNTSVVSTARNMPRMHDCGMKVGHHVAQLQTIDQCRHAGCAQQPQTLASDQMLMHPRTVSAMRASEGLMIPTSTQSRAHGLVASSPEHLPLLAALQTILRV